MGYLFALLSQLPMVDPVSGGAGWVGAGLLGLVLGWLLLKHLPAKDSQLDRRDEEKDKHIRAILTEFTQALAKNTTEFTATLAKNTTDFTAALNNQLSVYSSEQKAEREHCRSMHSENMVEHRATLQEIAATRHEMRNLLNQVILKKAVEDALAKKIEADVTLRDDVRKGGGQ